MNEFCNCVGPQGDDEMCPCEMRLWRLVLTPMDTVRSAIANAQATGLNIVDLARCAEHAETCEAFDDAVNLLAEATPNLSCEVTDRGVYRRRSDEP